MIQYEKNVMFRINTKHDNQLYTAEVIDQDDLQIKILSFKGEEVTLLRSDILKTKKIRKNNVDYVNDGTTKENTTN